MVQRGFERLTKALQQATQPVQDNIFESLKAIAEAYVAFALDHTELVRLAIILNGLGFVSAPLYLKDPLFFASSVFLKSPKRIAALGMIMALCLLIYNLGQRQLRQALAQNGETIPNQLSKPTAFPTLRWVFQCFMAVHFLVMTMPKSKAKIQKVQP